MKIILALISLLLSHQVWSDPAKILIIPFENATNSIKNDALVTGISEILTVCFSQYPEKVFILDRTSLDASLIEQSLSWVKFVNQNSNQLIGQRIGADFILRGSLVMKNDHLQLQALLFDVATTQLQHSVANSINIDHVVKSLCTQIANPLVTSLNKKTAISEGFVIETMPEKQQLLIEGWNHYYNGYYGLAFAPFFKLVTTDSNDALAHYWLAKSFYSAGLKDFAIIQLIDFISRFKHSSRIPKVQALLINLESNNEKK